MIVLDYLDPAFKGIFPGPQSYDGLPGSHTLADPIGARARNMPSSSILPRYRSNHLRQEAMADRLSISLAFVRLIQDGLADRPMRRHRRWPRT
jgi:hypothetical protein